MSFNKFAMDVFNNGLASTAVAMLNLQTKLPNQDPTIKSIIDGAVQTLAERIVDYFQGKDLDLFNYYRLMDDVLFNTLLYALINTFNLVDSLKFIQQLPIPAKAQEILIRGILSASGRTLYETLDGLDNVRYNQVFRYVLHPSDLMRTT